MSHPLDGCFAKIERADENIDNLQSELHTFFELAHNSIVRYYDPERREFHEREASAPVSLSTSRKIYVHSARKIEGTVAIALHAPATLAQRVAVNTLSTDERMFVLTA